jgi:hypothetical protein
LKKTLTFALFFKNTFRKIHNFKLHKNNMTNFKTKNNVNNSFKSLLTLLLVFLSINISAQRVINLNNENANANLRAGAVIPQEFLQEAKVARSFAINPALQSAGNVEIGDIVNLQLFEESNYTAVISAVTTDVNGNFTLTLKLPDYPFAFAIITTNTEGKSLVSVSIPTLGQIYGSRYSVNTGARYLIEVDESKIELPHCGTCGGCVVPVPQETEIFNIDIDGNIITTPQARAVQTMDCGPNLFDNSNAPATIDVLIAYTSATVTHTFTTQRGGINNVISTMIATGNTIFSNSQTGITLQLAHSVQVSYTEPVPHNMGVTLGRLQDPNDGYMDNVHALRRQYNADLVQLLTIESDAGGIGYLPGLTGISSPNWGFSVVGINSADGFTSAHEIGHNMGLGHSTQQTSVLAQGISSYSHGWRFQGTDNNAWGNTWHSTVMAYQGGQYYANGLTSARIPFFSNPNITQQGQSIGNTTLADAARSLREVKHAVAFYSDLIANLPDAPANIVVSNPTDNGATISWDFVPNAVSYSLAYFHDGGWWTYSPTSNNSFTFNNPSQIQSCSQLQIRINAINDCGGITNSQPVTFTTRCATDPTVVTQAATNMTTTTATLNSAVTPNGAAVTAQGFMYKANTSSTWLPSTTGNLTGLTQNTQYQFYAYATTALGTINGSVLTFATSACDVSEQIIYNVEAMSGWSGGWYGAELRVMQNGLQVQAISITTFAPPSSPVIVPVPLCPCKDIEFVWVKSYGDSGCSFVIKDNLGSTIFQTPAYNTSDPNAGCGGFANNQVVFSTASPCTPPTVVTQAATDISYNSAKLNKLVTAGAETITAEGFEYKMLSDENWQISTSGELTGLTANTDYLFRAYATTASGTTYGDELTFTTVSITTGIDETLANQLQIFPNPVKSELFIKSGLQIEKVEIYSLTGALLVEENNFAEKISVLALPQGVYLLKVHTDKGLIISKIIKE